MTNSISMTLQWDFTAQLKFPFERKQKIDTLSAPVHVAPPLHLVAPIPRLLEELGVSETGIRF